MSVFRGTPGPWQVCNGTDVFTPLSARNAAGVASAHNDGWHIADCDMGETQTDEGPATLSHAEKRANARLIAAAPALLEALRPLADLDLRPDGFDKRPDDQPIYSRDNSVITVGDVRRAIAAIRQATEGEQG